jgi:cyclohexanone monooxygenase
MTSPDVLIVGAGFSGMYMIHKLRQAGISALAVEAAPEVGGTWYHNRYPGCRCDVESMQYSFSFSEELRNEWNWSELYSPQPEILRYANWVADKLDLRESIVLNTRVASARWQPEKATWLVTSQDGRTWEPRFVVMATGCLTVPRMPDIPGAETFKGRLLHTADWPKEPVDVRGKRVGLIGTGSSGVQAATTLAPQAGHFSVFQRTPAYSVPAHNRPLTDAERQDFRDRFAELDVWARTSKSAMLTGPAKHAAMDVSPEERERILWEAWEKGGAFHLTATFTDVRKSEAANRVVADFVRERIREKVKDPAKAELLCPKDMIATRRICVDTGYFEIFNRDNVSLVDVASDAIAEITPKGLKLASGVEHELDILITATGYDAMTGAILAVDFAGENGLSMRDAWADGPRTYLGLTISGFPNLFMITGPGSPSALTNLIRSIEHHVEWITDCIADMRRHGQTVIAARREAQDAWVEHVNEVADSTLFTKARSWYMGHNVPGKPRVFMPYAGGMPAYVERCSKEAASGYPGFRLEGGASLKAAS